ncbi:hypothetical protein HXZ65_08920 [Acinetobacter indicus]|uniref:hypothetical protein n=1 Tax=Acinetobacter indicus TaxID=756892 RepID=UPI0025764985|nr:hypothetical protein [Acinetobacter indicus]MDM1278368.1 hypothetical protein [Acinetobacter indicus]MDM1281150.1 hypothetical protein [Acinetobacter indicus]
MDNYIDEIKQSPLYLTTEDLKDLPPALVAQLNITESDKKDMYLSKLIDKCGGIISLDKLLIAIYKDSGEIYERNKLMARLYRMSQKGLIHTHPSKKGQYSTSKWNTDEEVTNDEEDKDENL